MSDGTTDPGGVTPMPPIVHTPGVTVTVPAAAVKVGASPAEVRAKKVSLLQAVQAAHAAELTRVAELTGLIAQTETAVAGNTAQLYQASAQLALQEDTIAAIEQAIAALPAAESVLAAPSAPRLSA